MTDETKPEAVAAAPAAGAAAVSIDDFSKIDIRVGTVLSAEPIEGSEKLLKLSVDFGEATPRQVLSGIAKFVAPEELVGKQCPFVANLPARQMMGLESQAMILATRTAEGGCVLFHPAKPLPPGTELG